VWIVSAAEVNGKSLSGIHDAKKVGIVIKGNKVTFEERDIDTGALLMTDVATFTVDPTKNPKRIDITFKEDCKKDKKVVGIYKINGDELKLCYTVAGGKRPITFSSKRGTENNILFLAIYKKRKMAK